MFGSRTVARVALRQPGTLGQARAWSMAWTPSSSSPSSSSSSSAFMSSVSSSSPASLRATARYQQQQQQQQQQQPGGMGMVGMMMGSASSPTPSRFGCSVLVPSRTAATLSSEEEVKQKIDALLNKAGGAVQKGDWGIAQRALEDVLALNPTHLPAMVDLGRLLTGMDGALADHPRALQLFLDAARLGAAEGHFYAGHMYLSGGGFQKQLDEAVGPPQEDPRLVYLFEHGHAMPRHLAAQVASDYGSNPTFEEPFPDDDGGEEGAEHGIDAQATDTAAKAGEEAAAGTKNGPGPMAAVERLMAMAKARRAGDEEEAERLQEEVKKTSQALRGMQDHVAVDTALATEHLRAAAKMGHVVAMQHLGKVLMMHLGTAKGELTMDQMMKNNVEARDWFMKAAEEGHPSAMYETALLLINGESNTSTQKDPERAIQLWERAAEQHDHLPSMLFMAMWMHRGGDMQGAKRYLEMAIARKYAPAMHYQALMYLNGDGVVQNMGLWKHFIEQAAATGHPQSLHLIGTCQYDGTDGYEPDNVKALQSFQAAAVKRYSPSLTSLGAMYLHGEGTDVNLQVAYECYRTAVVADQTNITALRNLADMFERGIFVRKDPTAAKHYLDHAEHLQRIKDDQEITPEQAARQAGVPKA